MGAAPQSLLLPRRCPVCGRPARELSPCPWCGERVPLAPRTRGDLARIGAGLVLLAASAASASAANATRASAASAVPAGVAMATAVAGFLCGFFLAFAPPPSARGAARSAFPAAPPSAPRSALLASVLAVALRVLAVPHPLRAAGLLAWLLPAIGAAGFALRVSAEAPNAPATGATARVRTWRRHAPDLAAALSLMPFALAFAMLGATPISLVALALVLGVWFSRLARPGLPRLGAVACLSLLLPDPAALAFGLLAGWAAAAADVSWKRPRPGGGC